VSENRYNFPTPKPDATAGRIDLSRSNLFEWAKKLDPAAHVQVDTDIQFLQPAWEMMEIVFEDFEMGFDIIVAPTVAYNARVMTWGFEEQPHSHGPIKIRHAAFGWVAFSPRLLQGLKPLDTITNVSHEKLNLYCLSTSQTEDNSFCDNATKQGFRVGADFRLHVGHVKEAVLAPCLPDQAEEVKARYGRAAQFIVQDIKLMPSPEVLVT
jgi:hypothetical protein